MNRSSEVFLQEVELVAAVEHIATDEAAYLVMMLHVMAMARHIPPELRTALASAVVMHFDPGSDDRPVEPYRGQCWEYLDRKNGTSTAIGDRTDVAVRALICSCGM